MEKYKIGLELMILGMGTVVITLYLLSLLLRVNNKLLNRGSSAGKDSEGRLQEKNESHQIGKPLTGRIDSRKKAVISAAVYQMLAGGNYKIISIKKSNQVWKEGRDEEV